MKNLYTGTPVGKVFGIINLSPDSFSDGSLENLNLYASLDKAFALIKQGIDILDIGAESTRPGAIAISVEEEKKRLLPFLSAFRQKSDFPLSIDTHKPEIAEQALSYQIQFINDVSGLHNEDMARVIGLYLKRSGDKDLKIIVMHSKGGIPALPSKDVPDSFYDDSIVNHCHDNVSFPHNSAVDHHYHHDDMSFPRMRESRQESESGLYEHLSWFFIHSMKVAEKHGIDRDRLILDPGLGFGKNVKHSLQILTYIPKLKEEFNLPVLLGASRKSFLRFLIEQPDLIKIALSDTELSRNLEREFRNLSLAGAEDGTETLDKATQIYNNTALALGVDWLRVHVFKFY